MDGHTQRGTDSDETAESDGSTADAHGGGPDGEARTEYLLVTEYFHPDTAATGTLLTDLAVGLVDRGLPVSVLTSQPNYHSGENERQPGRSTHEGVDVARIRAPQLRQTSLPRRLFNWAVFTVWVSLALLVSRPDRERHVVVVSNPPFLPPAIWAVCRLRGWSYTYVVHDLYPDFLVATGRLGGSNPLVRAWRAVNRRVYGDAHAVVVLGPVMKERVVETTGVPAERVRVVHNWADGEFIRPREKAENPFSREHGLVEPFTLVYSGNIGANHDLETLVRAADRLVDDPVRVLIIGEGDNRRRIRDLAADLDVPEDTLAFLPYQDREVLPYSLTSGDASVVAVEEGLEGICVSSKLYTALATGTPVLAIASADDDVGRLVEAHDAGVQVDQGDVDGLVRAVRRWVDDPDLADRQGRAAREAFEDNYTREAAVDAYYRVLTGADPTPEDASTAPPASAGSEVSSTSSAPSAPESSDPSRPEDPAQPGDPSRPDEQTATPR